MMKKFLMMAVGALFVFGALTSCEGENDASDSAYYQTSDSEILLPKTRGFVLCEGSWNGNNAHLTVFDYKTDTLVKEKLYNLQNKERPGDTGQDLFAYDRNLFMVLWGSSAIYRMNGAGVRKAYKLFTEDDGQPRYAVADNGYVYVTTYASKIYKLKANNFDKEGMITLSSRPEQVALSNGKLYVVQPGAGDNYVYDNKMTIIDVDDFTVDETVEVCYDPIKVFSTKNGAIFVIGYDVNYNAKIYRYYRDTKQVEEIGYGQNAAVNGNTVYIVSSETDYTTTPYKTINTFYTYDAGMKTTNIIPFISGYPSKLDSEIVYSIGYNNYTGGIYIGTTDYTTKGTVYCFDSDGKYKTSFSAGGLNPSKFVFMNE